MKQLILYLGVIENNCFAPELDANNKLNKGYE
jgi:hypothetical protein